jgi:hypothetical protein
MNEANAKLIELFIIFSMGFTTGTLVVLVINNQVIIPTIIISAVLLSVSTVLFIFRAYEDDDTKLLRSYKKARDAFSRYDELVTKGKQ